MNLHFTSKMYCPLYKSSNFHYKEMPANLFYRFFFLTFQLATTEMFHTVDFEGIINNSRHPLSSVFQLL